VETHGHSHVQWHRHAPDTLRFLGWIVASGVTTFRDASAARLEEHVVAWRKANDEGRILGPRLYLSAVPHSALQERVGTSTRTETIRHFRELGIDGVKIMNQPLNEAIAVVREARRAGLPVYGSGVIPPL
jgi:hypothetical protein